jgi:hydroxypyruvate isomerase
MLQLAVGIELIFADRRFLDRIDTVSEAGLPGFEIWGWRDKDLTAIIERKERHGLELVNLALDPCVSVRDGSAIPTFVRSVRESCQAARELDCSLLSVHIEEVPWAAGGPWYQSLSDGRQAALRRTERGNIVRAFQEAAVVAEGEGITLLLEPLNWLVDHAGYYLSSSQEAFEMVQEIDSPAVRVLFDVYHQQITEGNLIMNLTQHLDLVAHVHVADVPGRHEPGTGEINYRNVLAAIKRAGYDGYVGLEYIPSVDSMASLAPIREIVDEINRREEA